MILGGNSAKAILCSLLLTLLLATNAVATTRSGNVSWVYDGDTIRVAGIGKVRLIGIDTPEKDNSARDTYYLKRYQIKRTTLRNIANRAFRLNLSLLKNCRVSLEFDQEKTDRYGRILAYVILPDGRMLNRLLLEKGLASVYRRFDFRLKKDFLRAERSARKQKLGLWHKTN